MPSAPYWVISTDYENYSLVYSCTNILWLFHFDYAWIMSRSPDMHPDTVEHLKSMLRTYKIDTDKMMPTDQLNCPAEMYPLPRTAGQLRTGSLPLLASSVSV